MNKKLNHCIFGSFGDNIYALCTMKMLGGGDLYVKLNYLDYHCRHIVGFVNGAGPHAGRLTKQDYDFMLPLLEHQDYIDTVSVWNGEHIDADIEGAWKYHIPKGWQGNVTESYAMTLGMDIHDWEIKRKLLYDPWLTPVEPIRIPGKPIVVNRTDRYLQHSDGEGWKNWTNNHLGELGVFVGSEKEHHNFQEYFKIKIQYYKVGDMLEMARLVQGCEMFLGNQSLAFSLAVGLGKSYWCEIYETVPTPHGGYGDVWFPRHNGFYF
jgi:hypothetical protein